jgi:transcription elongation GreA/GreB family factor
MTETTSDRDERDDLLALGRERLFDEFEAAWMRRIEAPSPDLDELYRAAEYLVRRKFEERAELLLWSLIAAVTEREGARVALEVAERCVEIAPEAASLREELAALLRAAHPDVAELPLILDASGLLSGAPPRRAMDRIRKCLRLRPGGYVIQTRSRRVGRVARFLEGAFEIESEGRVQKMQPDEVLDFWEPLPSEDFRALAAFEPERLKAMAAEDPIGLVTAVVASCGGSAEFKQLKAILIPAVISADGWSAWWNGVKVPLKRSPKHELLGGTQPTITLRKEDLGFADEQLAAFAEKADPYEKAKGVLVYLAELDAGHEADEALAVELANRCVALADGVQDAAEALTLLSCAVEVRKRFPASVDPAGRCAARLAAAPDIAAVVAAIPNDDLSRVVLSMTAGVEGADYPAMLAAAFPAGSLRLCEWIARELGRLGREDLLHRAMAETVRSPEGHFEALGWVWRRALSGEGAPGLPDPVSLTVLLLDMMRRLSRAPRHDERRADAKKTLGKLRAVIGGNDLRLVGALIAGADTEAARRLHDAIKNNEGLTGEGHHDLIALLREHHPEEFAEHKPLWEDGFLYSTPEGMARRQGELAKLVNEEIPRNAIAIGKAASLGDLRENWEYKSALEERDRLVERAMRAKEDVDRARVLDPASVSGDEVNIGTSITIRHVESGREKRITFLGPWDSDIARGIYSYLAPLSLGFMGRKIGDRVEATFDDLAGLFEIVGIEKAI